MLAQHGRRLQDRQVGSRGFDRLRRECRVVERVGELLAAPPQRAHVLPPVFHHLSQALEAVNEVLSGKDKQEVIANIKDEIPEDVERNIRTFTKSLCYPILTESQREELAKKINREKPTIFAQCVRLINETLLEGYTVGEQNASTTETKLNYFS